MKFTNNKIELEEYGYSILTGIYSNGEIDQIASCLENVKHDSGPFPKTKGLFAIRQLIKKVPELPELIFNQRFIDLISTFFKSKYFVTKAIYFDKPSESNWFVAYHQDLSISVDKRTTVKDYVNWTFRKGQYGVQPPIEILRDTITVRIHLDHTDEGNGALRVIPGSHQHGVIRVDSLDLGIQKEVNCNVEKGGVMLMKPLTLHASNRTLNGKKRRVIHLEFNKHKLPEPLKWLEYYEVKTRTD